MAEDPDPEARAELAGLLRDMDEAALRDRFDHPLQFGTAGLRGPLGAGPARMNRAVVRRTTAGLARFLLQTRDGGGSGKGWRDGGENRGGGGRDGGEGRDGGRAGEDGAAGVVIGHDARHGSAVFAGDAAKVVAAGGLRAMHFRHALPTPITAFAVRHLGAAAGVMITASHNPAPDNGYKVYLSDGAQLAPPYDEAIAAAASSSPVPGDAELAAAPDRLLSEVDEAEVLSAYRRAIVALVGTSGPRRLRIVYTPVHGVGGAVLPGLLEEAGFDPPALVPAQAEPDPDFPTAPFPNPEEPGVLDLARAEAARLRADLMIANDPDADRLAVAVPGRKGDGFQLLSGDQLGVLLADHLISGTTGEDRLVATTVVSSTMLSALAARVGVAYAETLTGFKWIARAARQRPGHRLLFGYEEALGYAVSDAVADKDGLSAALVVADMAARARAEGRSLLDGLDALEALLGVHATAQVSLRLEGSDAPVRLAQLMARWRAATPERLAGLAVSSVRDLSKGDAAAGLPPSDLLVLQLEGSARVVLRPSGTEPKLKAYLEVTTAPCSPAELGQVRKEAGVLMSELRQGVSGLLGG